MSLLPDETIAVLQRRASSPERWWKTFALILAIGCACLACGDGERNTGASQKDGERHTRVVLVTLDTLRFDSLMGGESGESAMPLTEAWARKGRIFERHYSSSSTTQSTHASLLTGLHPWQHGVTRNGQSLDERFKTVAEAFSGNGFRTGAVVSSFPLHKSFGFDQGFDVFDDDFELGASKEWSGKSVPKGTFYSLGGLVTEKAIAMIEELSGSRQFLWFHYFDMHEPYGDADSSEPSITLNAIYIQLRKNATVATPLVDRAKRRYHDDARALDRQLDRLFRTLYQDAEDVDTHVLVVSDHGESFGEGGSLGHGKRLSSEQLHVPCFVISPSVEPARVASLVSSVDVPATLFSLAGFEAETGRGANLLRPLPADRRVFGMRRTFVEPFFERRMDGKKHRLIDRVFFVAEQRGITTGNAEAVLSGPWAGDAPRNAAEPSAPEAGPLILFRAFEAEFDRTNQGSATELDEASRAALEALGYVQ